MARNRYVAKGRTPSTLETARRLGLNAREAQKVATFARKVVTQILGPRSGSRAKPLRRAGVQAAETRVRVRAAA